MKLVTALIVSLALCATALAGGGQTVNLPKVFAKQVAAVKARTTVPVLLPAGLPLLGKYRVYASGSATKRSFDLELAGAPNCGGANACFVAMFDGQRGGKLPFKPNVRLAGGDPAYYRHFTCGGSCSPSSFWFTHGGVLYSWQAKDLPKGEKAVFVRMANQAIAAGPR
jgi:hypothetical protein